MGSFQQGTRELAERIGSGDLVGIVEVDQVYAAVQHEGYWETGPNAGKVIRNHPQGGQAKYLEEPLFANAERYMERLAENVLEGSLARAMADNMEHLAGEVFDKAPREFEDLRRSAHPIVTDDGETVYDRLPLRPRLSRAALKEKSHRRPRR
jgi:hypothetical protein